MAIGRRFYLLFILWTTNNPFDRVYYANGDDIETIGMSIRHILSTFMPKRQIIMAARCYRYGDRLLLRRRKNEHLYGLPLSTYHWRPQIIEANWIHASGHIIDNTDDKERNEKPRMRRGHWVIDVCNNRIDSLSHKKQCATNGLLGLSKTNYMQGSPVETNCRFFCLFCFYGKGSLTSATIEVNFDSFNLSKLLSCVVQSVSSFPFN